jgi:hypothetical protein
VIQPGRDLDFPEKPIGAECRGQLRPQDLDGHVPVVFEVPGQVHRCHAAGANFAFDFVSVGKHLLKAGHGIGHRAAAWE